MAIYLYIEKEYIASSWCSEILEGLSDEKKRKKLKIITLDNLDELGQDTENEKSSVILIGSKHNWIANSVNRVLKYKMNPIVISNTQQSGVYAKYSNVSSDVFGAMGEAINLCRQNGRTKIALYGVNPDSAPDTIRKNAFLTFGGKKKDIYYNAGLLKGCFYNFLPNFDLYDAVICVNDFASISLINRLKKENVFNDNKYIISFNESVLCKAYSPTITAFSVNFKKFGAAAISIHETLSKNSFISSLNTLISYDLNIRESTFNAKNLGDYNDLLTPDVGQKINIYNDPELTEMIAVENLLKTADSADFKMIRMLKNKENYEAISDATYLSPSALKYRIKNLCKLFNADTVSEMLSIIEKHLDL